MNLTLEQYINGLERSVRELPTVLLQWAALDSELQFEYTEQLTWLLRERSNVLKQAIKQNRYSELKTRISNVNQNLFEIRNLILAKMNLDLTNFRFS